jgi:hypothetical protein
MIFFSCSVIFLSLLVLLKTALLLAQPMCILAFLSKHTQIVSNNARDRTFDQICLLDISS